MKKIGMLVLAACLLLSLAACGKNTETKKDTEESVTTEESRSTEESQFMEEPVDEETINGIINRLGDYLVLLGSDENYHIFEPSVRAWTRKAWRKGTASRCSMLVNWTGKTLLRWQCRLKRSTADIEKAY